MTRRWSARSSISSRARVPDLAAVRLQPGRDRSLHQRHPWVLSGSVAALEGDPQPGAEVRVLDAAGHCLGVGDFDPESQLRVRMTHFGDKPPAAEEVWLAERLARALAWRAAHPELRDTDALRLIHAEADALPGLTIDRYADWLAVKLGTPAMLRRAPLLAALLAQDTRAQGAWLRGEGPRSAERELFGSVPETPVRIQERGRSFLVDLRHGQKTGFYLDQRDARDLFARLAPGRRVLDLYAYTGGFAAAALQGGATSVVAVESSAPACALLAENAPGIEIAQRDVAEFLREDEREYDLISVDPPPFARRKRDVTAAVRAYKDVNLRALRRAAPGAHLLTFSCSHHVNAESFRHALILAAHDAGRSVQMLATLGAPPDHPVALVHPQGEYLSGLLLRIDA